MKELRSKLIAVSLVCLFAVSAASCQSANPDGTSTTVVTNSADDNNNDDNNSSNDNNDTNNNNSNDDAAVSEAPVPEKDDDGSKISVIEVTDSNNAPVTNKNGSKVTEIAIVNDKGQVITDAKGNNVKPNIKVTTKADRIVETKATEKNNAGGNNANNDNNNNNSNNNENNNSNSNIKHSAEGPTLSLPEKLEAKAGDTVTFKIPVTGNTGYTGLIAWIDIDENYFEFVSYDGGDTDDSNNDFSKEYNNTTFNPYKKPNADGTSTLVCMYFDASCESLVGNTTYATITLKVKDNTPAGEYKLEFDAATDGKAQCNNVNANKDIIVATPTYKNGSIIVK